MSNLCSVWTRKGAERPRRSKAVVLEEGAPVFDVKREFSALSTTARMF
jgi:ribosome-interacting GTPase 1